MSVLVKRRLPIMKRPLFAAITGIGLVSLLLTIVVSFMFLNHSTTHAGGIGDSGAPGHQNPMNKVATTINALTHIETVGSTAFIVDGQGHTISVDPNPYGVAIAPPSTPRSNVPGTLQAGDIVVTNFGGNNTGKTLVRFPAKKGTSFRVTQIGQLTMMGNDTKIALTWLSSLQLKGQKLSDVLLAIDPAKNRIAAYPNSSVGNINMKSTNKGITVFQGAPLAMPGGFTLNPLNGDLLVANGQRNDLVELNISQGKVIADRVIDNVPVDPKTNNGSALFGVVATTDAKNNLEVFFTDDNTNTLNVLTV